MENIRENETEVIIDELGLFDETPEEETVIPEDIQEAESRCKLQPLGLLVLGGLMLGGAVGAVVCKVRDKRRAKKEATAEAEAPEESEEADLTALEGEVIDMHVQEEGSQLEDNGSKKKDRKKKRK